ncbi:MAG: hypothetical protein ACYDH1_16495 [Anaerolineaceae bacterium]
MVKEDYRLSILKKVETGEISLESASRLLSEIEKLDEGDPAIETGESVVSLEDGGDEFKNVPNKPGWGVIFWILPLLLGVITTAFSANWLYRSFQNDGMGFGFWFSFIPLGIGIFLIYFSWVLERARWIHIFIRQPAGEKPQRIVLGFPLPLKFALSVIRVFKINIPGKFGSQDLEVMLQSIDQQINKQEPIYIDVDDKDGTKVEIYIG